MAKDTTREDLTKALNDGFARLGLAVELIDIFGAATEEVFRARELHGDQTDRPLGMGPAEDVINDGHFGDDYLWRPLFHADNNADLANYARSRCQDASAAGMVTWEKIVSEEFFEMLAEDDPTKIETEAIQTMAMLANIVIAARKVASAAA